MNKEEAFDFIIQSIATEVARQLNRPPADEELVYDSSSLALKLHTNENKTNYWRNHGLLKAIKKGSGYIYTQDAVKEFLKLYDGMDLANDVAIQRAKKRTSGPSSVGYKK